MTPRPVERPGINGQPKSSPEQPLQYVVKQNTHAVNQAQGRTPAGRAGVLLRHPCINASQITARLPGLSHYDKPPGPLATHHLHNNIASSPCRRGSTINIHQQQQKQQQLQRPADSSLTDIYKLRKALRSFSASRTRVG